MYQSRKGGSLSSRLQVQVEIVRRLFREGASSSTKPNKLRLRCQTLPSSTFRACNSQRTGETSLQLLSSLFNFEVNVTSRRRTGHPCGSGTGARKTVCTLGNHISSSLSTSTNELAFFPTRFYRRPRSAIYLITSRAQNIESCRGGASISHYRLLISLKVSDFGS